MREACRFEEGNPGLELGIELGEGWREGRDKVLVAGDFGLWVEQLLAESTGKEGKGLVPVAFGFSDDVQRPEFRVDDPYEVGQEFFRWEFATAVAGSILGINPFDQPDVQAAKDKTSEILSRGGEPSVAPEGDLDELLAQGGEGDYVSVQAFVDPAREAELEPILERARATGRPVAVGLGPRYLHSTGQLHKGGPDTGVFVQVVDDLGEELPIPGRPFGFRTLIAAQAAGDYEALKERGAPHRESDVVRFGMVGLGRMGSGMTERLRRHGLEVMSYDPKVDSTAGSLEELASQLDRPRVFWLMVPSGDITEATFRQSLDVLEEDDVLVDGGNSFFRDSIRRHEEAKARGIHFVDVGVSGGIWGLQVGFCLMAGGDEEPASRLKPIFEGLAPENGWAHVGGPGRGPLREDGPQRDRVRPDGGVRRGVRADEPLGVRPRSRGDRRHLALRLRRPLVAARPPLRVVQGARLEARGHRAVRRGLRRGALDDQRGDQPERARPRDRELALRALRVAARDQLRREGRGGAAEPVRRARGARGREARGGP
jgi:hypothetical protein